MTLVAVPLDSKRTEASFSPNLTDLLCLQLAQVPRSPDLVIFVYNDAGRQNRLLNPLRMHTG